MTVTQCANLAGLALCAFAVRVLDPARPHGWANVLVFGWALQWLWTLPLWWVWRRRRACVAARACLWTAGVNTVLLATPGILLLSVL